MFQGPLITQVLDWERRLEIENEKRKNYRDEPDYSPAAPRLAQKAGRSIFARIFRRHRRPVDAGYPSECCPETTPG